MIIDEQADFRTLLMHHITTHWPDAIISAYDPTAAGHLPDEFSGAGNDLILLGNQHGEDRDGIEVLQRFLQRDRFPPLVYFASEADEQQAADLGPEAQFLRDQIGHDELIAEIDKALLSKQRWNGANSMPARDLAADEPPIIRGYRFMRPLGQTVNSAVYLAERESTHQRVVLKILRQASEHGDDIGAFDRFLQEYETIAELDHPNIVRIYDLGVADDHAHIAMEYLDGGDLRHKIEAGVPALQAVEYLRQIAGALSAVHAKGVLHRDLKPGNIMLRGDGSIGLIDFGLAKRVRLESAITDKGEIFGTPYYISPEQGHGIVIDERSDLHSLGVIFYELLTGEKPYTADTAMGLVIKHAQAPIPLLPPRLATYQALMNMLLAKKPEDRLQSAKAVCEWL